MKFDDTLCCVQIVFESASVADFVKGGMDKPPRVLTLPAPSPSEQTEVEESFSQWIASEGHICNPSCRPPWSHYSTAAYQAVERFLAEDE